MELITYENFIKNRESIFNRLFKFVNEHEYVIEVHLVWFDHTNSIGIVHYLDVKYADYAKLTQFLEQANSRNSVGTVALNKFNSMEVHAFSYFIGEGFVYEQLQHLLNAFIRDVIRIRDIAKYFSLNNDEIKVNN